MFTIRINPTAIFPFGISQWSSPDRFANRKPTAPTVMPQWGQWSVRASISVRQFGQNRLWLTVSADPRGE
jgi:hypothetical protein